MSSTVPQKRLRLSIWVGNVPLDDATVVGGRMIVDDLTMIWTLLNEPTSTQPPKRMDMKFKYEINVNPDRTAQEVAACHKHQIQCLAGMGLSGTGSKKGPSTLAFEAFLAEASDAQIDAAAAEMVRLIDGNTKAGARTPVQTFDGIGFDNESVSAPGVKTPLVKFYRAVAKALAATTAGGGRFVSVAAAPLSSPDHVVLAGPLDKDGARADGFMLDHPYEMSAGLDNLVVRPMCYDTFRASPATPAATRAAWHADILDYAVGTGKTNGGKPATRAAVFQMGFKNAMGFHNNPNNVGKKDPTGLPFQNLDGIVDPGTEMEDVCWRMRQAGVGVVLFAFPDFSDTATRQPKPRAQFLTEVKTYFARVARYNFALNGAATASGPDWSRFKPDEPWADTCTPGPLAQPVQVPIGKDGQARLGKP